MRIDKITFDGIKDLSKAEKLLASADQRDLRPAQIKRIAEKYLTKQWREGMDPPMVVTKKKKLKAGQHRIAAWIMAVKIQPDLKVAFDIKYEVPDEFAYAAQCDEIAVTATDALKIAGLNGSIGKALKIFINRGMSIGRPKMEDIIKAARPYQTVLIFAKGHIDGKKIGTAPVHAAAARALFVTKKEAEIAHFSDILCGRVPPKTAWDQFPFNLQKSLVTEKPPRSNAEVLRCYRRTEEAIRAFLAKETFKDYIKAQSKELYILPAEVVDAGKPARLIPIIGCPSRTADDVVKTLLARGRMNLFKIKYSKMDRNTPVCFFSPSEGRVRAKGVFQKVDKNGDGEPVLVFSNIVAIDAKIDAEKLVRLSRSTTIQSLKTLGDSISKITTRDIDVLAKF